jgi:hypothetical protein
MGASKVAQQRRPSRTRTRTPTSRTTSNPLIPIAILAGTALVHALIFYPLRRRRRRRQQQAALEAEAIINPALSPAADAAELQCTSPFSAEEWNSLISTSAVEPVQQQGATAAPSDPLPLELVSTTLPCTPKELLMHIFHPTSQYLTHWGSRVKVERLEALPWRRPDISGVCPVEPPMDDG